MENTIIGRQVRAVLKDYKCIKHNEAIRTIVGTVYHIECLLASSIVTVYVIKDKHNELLTIDSLNYNVTIV